MTAFTFGASRQFGYREICEIEISGASAVTRVAIGDVGGGQQFVVGPTITHRWVAARGNELILLNKPCVIDATPAPQELAVMLIYDVERRKELLPASLRDLTWNRVPDWSAYDDDGGPIYRIKYPFLVFHRRRKYPRKLYMEQIVWMSGTPISYGAIALDHMDEEDGGVGRDD